MQLHNKFDDTLICRCCRRVVISIKTYNECKKIILINLTCTSAINFSDRIVQLYKFLRLRAVVVVEPLSRRFLLCMEIELLRICSYVVRLRGISRRTAAQGKQVGLYSSHPCTGMQTHLFYPVPTSFRDVPVLSIAMA